MPVYIYQYKYTQYIYIYTHIYRYRYIYRLYSAPTQKHMCFRFRIHWECLFVYIYICIYICIYIYICMHIPCVVIPDVARMS